MPHITSSTIVLATWSALLSVAPLVAQQAPAAPTTVVKRGTAAAPLVFKNVTVVDVTTGHRVPGQTVVVVGTRIRTVGATARVPIPAGAQVVNAQGLYVIPGLWDMHVHSDDASGDIGGADTLYPHFIAYGVTGLREMAQRFHGGADSCRSWQRQIAADTRVGPRVFGPSVDLMWLYRTNLGMRTPDGAPRVVDSLHAVGIRFLKIHDDHMDRTLYFAVAHEARRIGIPFVGHLPDSVTEVEASDSGQKSIEHINEFHCWPGVPVIFPATPPDSLAEQRCAPVVAAFLRNGTWFDPTLAAFFYSNPEDLGFKGVNHGGPWGQEFVRMMHHLGVRRILAGTDVSPNTITRRPPMFPGSSLLDEIGFLAGAGLTPLEALQTATLNPAIFFNATDSLGTVAPGKLADLVLLTADPLADIQNVRKIRAVVANGRYFDRAALDAFSPPIEQH